MTISAFDIAILGAGPVGRVLALMLARVAPDPSRIALLQGASPAPVTPAAAVPAADPRVLAMNHGSRVLLESLHAWPAKGGGHPQHPRLAARPARPQRDPQYRFRRAAAGLRGRLLGAARPPRRMRGRQRRHAAVRAAGRGGRPGCRRRAHQPGRCRAELPHRRAVRRRRGQRRAPRVRPARPADHRPRQPAAPRLGLGALHHRRTAGVAAAPADAGRLFGGLVQRARARGRAGGAGTTPPSRRR